MKRVKLVSISRFLIYIKGFIINLLCTHYGPLLCFSTYFCKLKKIGVLRTIFPGYVISCEYSWNKNQHPPDTLFSENIAQNVDTSLEESAPPSSLIYQFSVKIDNFEFFGLNLGKFPIRAILRFE